MSHTPSIQTAAQAQPESPNFSSSGIMNQQIKEKNRQGLLSNYVRGFSAAKDFNRFTDRRLDASNQSYLPYFERLNNMLVDVKSASQANGIQAKTSNKFKAYAAADIYNKKVDELNEYLSEFDTESGITKAGGVHNFDKRAFHSSNYGVTNKGEVNESINKIGTSNDLYNAISTTVKAQNKTKKTATTEGTK